MQSGISASKELRFAFQALVSDPSQFALFATISKEQLIPGPIVSCTETSNFSSSISHLTPHLAEKEPAFIILRRYPSSSDGFIAITYVPDTAPVRQKMLFASTRLTLVRELGIERFRETIFATTKAELTEEGFKKHDQHVNLAPPLTEEEQSLGAVKRAEAEEGLGMSVKKAHVSDKLAMNVSEEAIAALRVLGEKGLENLVQLKIDIPTETVDLVSASTAFAGDLSKVISTTEPRYSFFKYVYAGSGDSSLSAVIFIYTCPGASKVKERMIYATTCRTALRIAEQEAGLKIDKRLEVSNPEDITEKSIEEEFRAKVEVKKAFDRPKRPGRK